MNIEKIFSDSPVFETQRVYLRKLSLDDADDYFSFVSNPLVAVHTIWDYHKTILDSINFLKTIQNKYEAQQAFHWGVVVKSTNKLIGRTGFISFDNEHRKSEIGFALSYEYWGQGIITEASRPIIQYGFEELELNRIEGRCNSDNIGSERVMQKLGMTFEGVLREQLNIKGKFKDQKIYSILRKEFAR